MPRQLGCNYSRPLLRLLEQGAVHVDWIKLSRVEVVAEELAAARSARPVLLHILPAAGCRADVWEGFPWGNLPRWAEVAGSPHVAAHLETRPEDWDEPIPPQYQTREQTQAALERFCTRLRSLQQRLPVPVLIENGPIYSRGGMLRLCGQPGVIWQVVEETGAGLLLDTSHLRCAAWHMGIHARSYAQALPLRHVRELHVAGPRLLPDFGLRDRHLPLQEEDWALVEWLLERTDPAIVTLEYGGTGPMFETPARNDPQQLEAQLRRLSSMLE